MTAAETTDPVLLALTLVDIPSVSGDEGVIADLVEATLGACPHLEVLRDGDAVVARTRLGRGRRIVIAGHLDTVPIAGNVPGRIEERCGVEVLWGRGSVDMLSGVAAALHLAVTLTQPRHDVTWVFYDHEEVAAELNGLARVVSHHPDWLAGDLAVLGEPTAAQVEGGCNGTLRVIATIPGVAAHSARSWRGDNAIHRAAPVIARIAAFGNPVVPVDGLDYRESLSVVRIQGGVANNVIPDALTLVVNYRFAPSSSGAQALEVVRGVFEGTDARLVVDDLSEGARPGMDSPLAQEFLRAARLASGGDVTVGPKYGWTDVARFSALGVPALNFGPGDPMLAHTVDEHVPTEQIRRCVQVLRSWLGREEE